MGRFPVNIGWQRLIVPRAFESGFLETLDV
jgi:hypothetical protein